MREAAILDSIGEQQLQEESEESDEPAAPIEILQSGPISHEQRLAQSNPAPDQLENSEDWIALFSHLPLEGMLKSICGQLSFRTRVGDEVAFDIDPSVSGVLSDKYQTKFAEILSVHLGQKLQVVIDSQDGANESPTARATRLLAEALADAEAQLLESSAAQILSEAFDAKLVPGSVNLK